MLPVQTITAFDLQDAHLRWPEHVVATLDDLSKRLGHV